MAFVRSRRASPMLGCVVLLLRMCPLSAAAASECPQEIGGMHVSACWPATAGSRTLSVTDLTALRDIGGARSGLHVSPDRKSVAFQLRQMDIATNRHVLSWHVLSVSGGSLIRIGDGGDLITSIDEEGTDNGNPSAPIGAWSPDGNWFAYLRKSSGQIQVWRARRDGTAEEQLTRSEGDVRSFAWLSSSLIAFTADASRLSRQLADQKAREDGFRWDERFWPRYSWMPRQPRTGDGTVWVVDSSRRSEHIADAKELREFQRLNAAPELDHRPRVRLSLRSPDASRVASLQALDRDLQGESPPLTLVVSRLPHGRSQICGEAACVGRIKKIWWSKAADRVYFMRAEGHGERRTGLYEWDLESRKVRPIFSTDGWVGEDCAILEDRAVCLFETVLQPRRIVSIDLHAGSVTTLFDPNPDLMNVRWTQVVKLEWRDAFANETLGHLVFPPDYDDHRTYPLVIVQYHSPGGFLRGGTGDEYPIHVLAAHGMFVLSWDRPEFRTIAARTSVEERTKYAYSDHREFRSVLSALDAVVDAVISGGLVDSSRIGLSGLSNGAYTAHAALLHSNRYAAASVSQAPTDPIAYYLLPSKYRSYMTNMIGMTQPDESETAQAWWRYRSLSLNVDRLETPILYNLSDAELTNAAQAIATLQEARKPFDAYIYPGEFHIKHQPRHLQRIMERNVDWFDFWLLDAVDPAPEKREQYLRWFELRSRSNRPVRQTER